MNGWRPDDFLRLLVRLENQSLSSASGRSRSMRLMASRTSLAAWSVSMSGRNSMRMRELFSSLEELMLMTPATRAAAPSRSRVTSASMVSGEAPGKNALTETTGRSTSGSSPPQSPSMRPTRRSRLTGSSPAPATAGEHRARANRFSSPSGSVIAISPGRVGLASVFKGFSRTPARTA